LPWLWIALILLATLWMSRTAISTSETIPYSEFKQHLAKGELEEVLLEGDAITGTLRAPANEQQATEQPGQPAPEPPGILEAADPADAKSEEKPVTFRTVRVEDPDLVKQLEAADIPYSAVLPDPFGQVLLSWILPIGLVLLVTGWLFRSTARRAGSQMMGFGKSKARLVPETGTGVTFDDVAGCDEAKGELGQMVAFLKNPGRFTALGGRIPKGVLLLGPPGTGKTLLARAVAGEAGVPFFSLSGSDFVEMFVGVGAARVRDLFAQATAKAPCIIFVDEIDAIGRQRGISMGVVNDEREQTLNQLLSEMDGFENNSGVILLAATNRPEILDRALLRPGRFDRQVVLDSPDLSGREAILRVHTRGKPLAPDVDLARIAQVTPGMSGADLSNAVNEAALLAADRNASEITQRDLEDAVERVVAGPERRSRRLQPEEKRRVAYHESGHALVAARCEHADPVRKITIVPRGRAALGYTMQLPEQERFLHTKDELLDRLAVTLGGRAAEELVFGDVSTGPQDDLRVATDIARQMVCVFGMSERLGLPQCARPSESFLSNDGAMVRDCSEETSQQIDEEVRDLLDAARNRARTILESGRDVLERIVTQLLEGETLDRAAFDRIVGRPARPDAS
jgi:cell division protease FtsH